MIAMVMMMMIIIITTNHQSPISNHQSSIINHQHLECLSKYAYPIQQCCYSGHPYNFAIISLTSSFSTPRNTKRRLDVRTMVGSVHAMFCGGIRKRWSKTAAVSTSSPE
jgi:hypothetical protein